MLAAAEEFLMFQTFDNKKECTGVYEDGHIYYEDVGAHCSGSTWGYSPFNEEQCEYASLYYYGSTGRNFPGPIQLSWDRVKDLENAFRKSFETSKVPTNEVCFFDLVPEYFLYDYGYALDKITKYALDNFEKPGHYETLKRCMILINEISKNRLNLDFSNVKYKTKSYKEFKDKNADKNYVDYNMFNSVTGRLSTPGNSFPILTIPKKFRTIVKPTNDLFIEIDYNAADLRMLFALEGQFPEEDLHEWVRKKISIEDITRDDLKKEVFSWLYNSSKESEILEDIIDKKSVLNKFYNDGVVENVYGRRIESDDFHSLSYLAQSTCNDTLINQSWEIRELLKGKKSFISFLLHDSIILDVSSDEMKDVKAAKDIFEDTVIGKIKSNWSIGTNFGNLRRIS